jgi:glutaminase
MMTRIGWALKSGVGLGSFIASMPKKPALAAFKRLMDANTYTITCIEELPDV